MERKKDAAKNKESSQESFLSALRDFFRKPAKVSFRKPVKLPAHVVARAEGQNGEKQA